MTSLLPRVSKEALVKEFVGKSLREVPAPAAVLDLTKMKNNCGRMLEAVEQLNFSWRAHIKTHKTTELTRLQVGDGAEPAKIIVSTLIEAEEILPLMLEYKAAGREVSLLYGLPVAPSAIPRVKDIAKAIGPYSLCLLVDHPDQVLELSSIPTPVSICLKIDMGYHRAGVIPQTESCSQLISSVLALESSSPHSLLGLYAHAGHSYSGSSQAAALDLLRQEFEALMVTAAAVQSASPGKSLVLSVGATPTTTSVRNLLLSENDTTPEAAKEIHALRATMDSIRVQNCTIEIHAGVYATLDLQQFSIHALPETLINWDDLAFTIVAEVISLYTNRGANASTEALIGAGTLALGREPCKAYPGWGIVSPWNREGASMPTGGTEGYVGWTVGKISQEHGILTHNGKTGDDKGLKVGQKVRIWPNHACVAGAGFGWYLIVDGSDEIIDVWPRWRGW